MRSNSLRDEQPFVFDTIFQPKYSNASTWKHFVMQNGSSFKRAICYRQRLNNRNSIPEIANIIKTLQCTQLYGRYRQLRYEMKTIFFLFFSGHEKSRHSNASVILNDDKIYQLSRVKFQWNTSASLIPYSAQKVRVLFLLPQARGNGRNQYFAKNQDIFREKSWYQNIMREQKSRRENNTQRTCQDMRTTAINWRELNAKAAKDGEETEEHDNHAVTRRNRLVRRAHPDNDSDLRRRPPPRSRSS